MTDVRALTVRRLEEDDRQRLLEFGAALDKGDWLYLDVDLQEPTTVNRLIHAVDARNWRQLVALDDDDRIVGYANVRQLAGWKSHVGDVALVVRSDARGGGVGSALARSLIDVATELPIYKLVLEIVEEQQAGRAIFKHLGFRFEGLLEDHAVDHTGQPRNLALLAYHYPKRAPS